MFLSDPVVCLQPSTPFALLPLPKCNTFPELTNASAKTTTNYIKKATAVTAASMMVASSTSNPMVRGLTLGVWVCYSVPCGLDFVFGVFSCFVLFLKKLAKERPICSFKITRSNCQFLHLPSVTFIFQSEGRIHSPH